MNKKRIRQLLIASLILTLPLWSFGCSTPPQDAKPTEKPIVTPVENPSEEPKPTEASAPTVIYLVGEASYEPLSFKTDSNEIAGISPEIIREVFKRMDVELKLELLPWAECTKMVQTGEADGLFSVSKAPESEGIYTYVPTPLIVDRTVLVVKGDSLITFDGDLKRMHNYTLGTLIGSSILEPYTRGGTLTRIDDSLSLEEALKKLTSHRGLDILVYSDLSIQFTAKQLNLSDKIQLLSKPLSETPVHLAFTTKKDMKDLASKFDAELNKMIQDGTYDTILSSYK